LVFYSIENGQTLHTHTHTHTYTRIYLYTYMTPQRQVGTLAAHGAMASLFFGSCVSGQHAGKQVREREHARMRARAREREREHARTRARAREEREGGSRDVP
jgi:hypothetical protein